MLSFGLLESCLFRLVAAAGSVAWYPLLVHPSLGVTRETAVFMCGGSRMRPALGSSSGGLMSPSTCLAAHTLFRRRGCLPQLCRSPCPAALRRSHPFPPLSPPLMRGQAPSMHCVLLSYLPRLTAIALTLRLRLCLCLSLIYPHLSPSAQSFCPLHFLNFASSSTALSLSALIN